MEEDLLTHVTYDPTPPHPQSCCETSPGSSGKRCKPSGPKQPAGATTRTGSIFILRAKTEQAEQKLRSKGDHQTNLEINAPPS